MTEPARAIEVERLRRGRERSLFLRFSATAFLLLIVGSFVFGSVGLADAVAPRRIENLSRFLHEVVPYPLRDANAPPLAASRWAADLIRRRGWESSIQTLALSVSAIVLAGAVAMLLALPAARNVASAEPFGTPGGAAGRAARFAWRSVVGATRLLLMFFRAIPEYVWAFLLLAMLGQQAWPAVLALAIHNAGVLGRLGGEVVENVEPAVPRALRQLGGTRLQVATVGVLPLVLPRFLLYFFYRWETCVREATVLGLLGFTSLGYWVADARARDRYDEMVLYVALGALLVLVGDVVSAATRAVVRRAS